MEENKKNSFLIIDGNSIMNRAYYGIRLLTTKDGLYTNAVYGFLNILYMMLEKLNPSYVSVAFDLSAPTFRHKIYEKYKDGRKAMPDELRIQMPIIKEVLNAMNIPILELEGYEADDILGTISTSNEKKDIHTYILTGDRDALQLISDISSIVIPTTKMGKTEYVIYTPEELKERYGILPSQVIEVKSLMGDSSDNIPGVPGIGEKTAYSLITNYFSLDNIYNNIDNLEITPSVRNKLKENKDIAFLSKELATINRNVPIDINYEKLKLTDVNLPEITKIYTRLAFKKFLEKYTIEGEAVLDTKEATAFYKNLDKTKFIILKNEKDILDILSNNTATEIAFHYFDDNTKYLPLKNYFIFNINNNVYLIRFNKDNVKTILNEFCKMDVKKLGYDIKKVLKQAFDLKIDTCKGFCSDISIQYHLLHSHVSNYSIENITYNTLNITFPELELPKKKQLQTNIFDILEHKGTPDTDETKLVLNEDEKRHIFAYLEAIKQINNKLLICLQEEKLYDLYTNIEIPLIETLANIESIGMFVDLEKLKTFGKYLEENIQSLTEKIHSLAGEEFNINSPLQLGKILFEKLSLTASKKNKEGYSTDKETLELIVDDHEIIEPILEYRTLAKLKSTYIEGLMNAIQEDGRIHTTFMQTSTSTGRLSSIEPNLQNIPVRTDLGSKIRECFVAQGSNIIIDADYSQIELRILACMSNDQNMINAFNSNKDIHSITASQVFDVPLEDVTKDLRSKAKAVNFGIVYGISDYGLAKNIHSTRQEAKTYIANYLNKYSNIDKYMKSLIEEGKINGFVSTMFGRKRQVRELNSSNYNTRTFAERIAMNMPIQGTAADIIKIAMNNIYRKLKDERLKSKIIMQVHDELLVEGPAEEFDTVKEIIQNCMESAVKLQVPITVDINKGKSWLEAK